VPVQEPVNAPEGGARPTLAQRGRGRVKGAGEAAKVSLYIQQKASLP
jgi:hypothetical protein